MPTPGRHQTDNILWQEINFGVGEAGTETDILGKMRSGFGYKSCQVTTREDALPEEVQGPQGGLSDENRWVGTLVWPRAQQALARVEERRAEGLCGWHQT